MILTKVAQSYSTPVKSVLFSSFIRPTRRSFSTLPYNADVCYYSRLGLQSTATQDEIKRKFYDLAKKHHPDAADSKPSDEDRFK